MTRRLVTMVAPKAEQLDGDAPDGWWPLSPRARLRATRDLAKSMQVPWLPPYVPRFDRVYHDGQPVLSPSGDLLITRPMGWETTVGGYLRATPVRALRLHFEDSAGMAADCKSCRVLTLAARWKDIDADVRWADMGDMAAWPMALRVDARRLNERLAVVALALWCRACDDAPSASRARYCLWCERQGWMPGAVPVLRVAA